MAGMSFMDGVINDIPNISIITKIEVLGFKMNKQDTKLLYDFVDSGNVIYLNDDIVNKTIDLRRNHKIKIPDAIIAATALAFNFQLITRNLSDFKKIEGLRVVNPHEL